MAAKSGGQSVQADRSTPGGRAVRRDRIADSADSAGESSPHGPSANAFL